MGNDDFIETLAMLFLGAFIALIIYTIINV